MSCCRWLGMSFVWSFCAAAFAQQSPEAELAALRVPAGWQIELFASEPMITNPAAIDIDTHGRVWVAEIQWYRAAAKNPPADCIKVLEDTDGDGVADKSTVFAEGIFAPMSICVAGDKVYVATSPDLWVYEDRNGDLVADGPPTKLLTGFGGFNHDHGAHSLVLGPDHKWWMSHGDTGFNVTGPDGSHIEYRWGAMLRGELDGTQLETIAVNFRNPYEICVNSFGESFCSDNDNDGNFSVRICWILDGGNYGWFGGPPPKVPPGTPFGEHWHFRGHIPGHVPATLVTGFGSPTGICFYEGDAFGPEYKNAPLHTDAGPREVRIYRHEPAGYGMHAKQRVLITSDGDNYFRPDDICTAPDGSLYLADWYDGGVGGHAYNNPTQGRIFRLTPQGRTLERVEKPGPYTTVAEAIVGLQSPNLATQFLAREKLLAAGQASQDALASLLFAEDPNFRARALWVLDRIGGEARKLVEQELQNPDAAFRALAVRILRRHGAEYAEQLLPLVHDSSAEVRREVLLSLRSLDWEQARQPLVELAARYDGHDRYQLEALNIVAGDHREQLYAALEEAGELRTDQLALLQLLNPAAATEFLTRRLAASGLDEAAQTVLLQTLGGNAAPEAGEAVLKLAADSQANADVRRLALQLLGANLGGSWQALVGNESFRTTLRQLLADPALQVAALELAAQQGLTDLSPEILACLTSDDEEVRAAALRTAVQLRLPDAASALESLLAAGGPLRGEALRALIDLQAWPAVSAALAAPQATPEEQSAAVERMMATSAGAIVLLRWMDEDKLPSALRAQVLALAMVHVDANVRALFERFIPEDQRPIRLGSAISAEEILALTGDAERGRQIFVGSSAAQCKNCHRVQDVGGGLGPNLSQIGRKYERAALLETILNPSKAIAPEFIPYVLETDAGQIYAGFLLERTDDHVVLKDIQSQLYRVPMAEVVALEQQAKSLMPELVLRDVTAQDAADLLAYLASLNQSTSYASQFRLLGPFAAPDRKGLDYDFGPENALAHPDLSAGYADGGFERTWQVVEGDAALGYPAFDQLKYAQQHGLPGEAVVNYFLLYADSAADQTATLQMGSDDDCRVWVNGQQVHEHRGDRALNIQDDRVTVELRAGRNVIVVKVENHQGPGGVALSVSSPSFVELKTE